MPHIPTRLAQMFIRISKYRTLNFSRNLYGAFRQASESRKESEKVGDLALSTSRECTIFSRGVLMSTINMLASVRVKIATKQRVKVSQIFYSVDAKNAHHCPRVFQSDTL
jgi:hypothetical protein